MMIYRYTLVLTCVFLSIHHSFAQFKLSKETIINFSSNDINELNFESYTIDDFSETFDVAVALINDKTHPDYPINGTNVLAALAKEFHLKVKHKQFDLDAANTELLLKKFETQAYYISRPTPGQFLKLMKYSCQGDYSHIYDRFHKSSFYVPILSALVIYLLMLIVCIFKKKNKRCARFIRLSVIGFVLVCTVAVVFKMSCEENIQDYSFYGITM